MKVGDRHEEEMVLSAHMVEAFGRLTGDVNPVHFDVAAATAAGFDGPIVHGLLATSFFSYLLGTKLPGPGTIFLGQSVKFQAPILVGERVTYRLEVRSQKEGQPIYTLGIEIIGDDGVLRVSGEAVVKAAIAATG